jgi:hypothetical protein
MAGIARDVVLRAGVANCQLAPAAATPDKVTQQYFPHLIAPSSSLCLGGYCCRNRTRADYLEQRSYGGAYAYGKTGAVTQYSGSAAGTKRRVGAASKRRFPNTTAAIRRRVRFQRISDRRAGHRHAWAHHDAGLSECSRSPALPPPGGSRDRPRHIGGKPDQQRSEPLRRLGWSPSGGW